jgi:cytidylate kinase
METEAIVKAASEQAVIVVGRGASHLLRAHPKHVAVFLHASKELRVQRTQQIYGMSRKEAVCSIDKADIERARYNKSLSGFDMCDATQYHLCLDTGVIGIDKAEELIIQYVHARFPDTAS